MRYIIVPVIMDEDGKVDTKAARPPYGFHHIVRVYDDGSYFMVASLFMDIAEAQVLSIASLLAAGNPLTVDLDFYKWAAGP